MYYIIFTFGGHYFCANSTIIFSVDPLSSSVYMVLKVPHSLKETCCYFRCNSDQDMLKMLVIMCQSVHLTLEVLVTTIDAQWEGMGDVGSSV